MAMDDEATNEANDVSDLPELTPPTPDPRPPVPWFLVASVVVFISVLSAAVFSLYSRPSASMVPQLVQNALLADAPATPTDTALPAPTATPTATPVVVATATVVPPPTPTPTPAPLPITFSCESVTSLAPDSPGYYRVHLCVQAPSNSDVNIAAWMCSTPGNAGTVYDSINLMVGPSGEIDTDWTAHPPCSAPVTFTLNAAGVGPNGEQERGGTSFTAG